MAAIPQCPPSSMLGDPQGSRKLCLSTLDPILSPASTQETRGNVGVQRKSRGWAGKTVGVDFCSDALCLPFPWGQPHLTLPNDHIPVFSLLQDSEYHVSLQLVKHLWKNKAPGTFLLHFLDPLLLPRT